MLAPLFTLFFSAKNRGPPLPSSSFGN